jgi:hypothetical protein
LVDGLAFPEEAQGQRYELRLKGVNNLWEFLLSRWRLQGLLHD